MTRFQAVGKVLDCLLPSLPLVADCCIDWHNKWAGKSERLPENILEEWYFLAFYFCKKIVLIFCWTGNWGHIPDYRLRKEVSSKAFRMAPMWKAELTDPCMVTWVAHDNLGESASRFYIRVRKRVLSFFLISFPKLSIINIFIFDLPVATHWPGIPEECMSLYQGLFPDIREFSTFYMELRFFIPGTHCFKDIVTEVYLLVF